MNFRALEASLNNGKYKVELKQLQTGPLKAGQVRIRSKFSSLNYKDALAVTGEGKILKSFPLTPGIDVAGEVIESSAPAFTKGQAVLVTGSNMGEVYSGGYGEVVDAPAEAVVAIPKPFTAEDVMIIGTAGFTAALALDRMLQNDQTPEKGPIAITGASGGVGQFAVRLFSAKGFEVIAVSGKKESVERLKSIGASQVLAPDQLQLGSNPLEKAKFGGVVDNVGGALLSQLLAHTQLWGNVASIGLADSAELKTTVMPFILRGVSILGVSSNNCTRQRREKLWQQLSTVLTSAELKNYVAKIISLEQVPEASEQLLQRKISGRVVIRHN